MELSTLLNVNREFYTSNKQLLFAIKDYALESAQAQNFANLPGIS